MSVAMFVTVWAAWPLLMYIFHGVTMTPRHGCLYLVTCITACCSIVFFLMGFCIDLADRSRLKRAFLRKLES